MQNYETLRCRIRNTWKDHYNIYGFTHSFCMPMQTRQSVWAEFLPSIHGNIRVGQSETFITECEYTNSFLSFSQNQYHTKHGR